MKKEENKLHFFNTIEAKEEEICRPISTAFMPGIF